MAYNSDMRAMVYEAHGTPDRLHLAELPEPEPAPGEVKIRVRAAALNGFDPMMLAGSTGLKVPLPMVPCGDFAGEVVAANGVESPAADIGQRVTGYPILPGKGMMGEVTAGAACEYVCIPASCAVPFPERLSFAEAAALPVAYGTAYRMMLERGGVSEGERVLVLGATGGVGAACVQIAKHVGAEVIACGSGDGKLSRLDELGADAVLDTGTGDFRKLVYERFGKPAYDGGGDGGVDVLVNYIGGPTWADGLKVVRKHGRVLVCGATAGYAPNTDLRYIWSYEQNIIGSNGWSPADQAAVLAAAADGWLKPALHDVRPLASLPGLMQELIDRRVFGKAVVTI